MIKGTTIPFQFLTGRPCPPEMLEVVNLTPTAATIAWTVPEDCGGGPVTHYNLEKKESGQKKWETLTTLPAVVMECELENMVAGKEYYVRVRAVNKMGMGDPQYLKYAITVEGMQKGRASIHAWCGLDICQCLFTFSILEMVSVAILLRVIII